MTRTAERLDEDTKRLLAAILEFTAVMRHGEPRADGPESGLGLSHAMKERRLGPRHASALLAVALWGPMPVSELAARHHVLVKTASLVAVELEQAGFIERTPDPTDRRRTMLTIAHAKRAAIEEGLARRAAALTRTLSQLSGPQREGLILGLEALARDRQGPISKRPIDDE